MTNDVHARSRLIPKGERTRVRIIDAARLICELGAAGTTLDDVGCDEAMAVLHIYVDLAAAGQDPAERYPRRRRPLRGMRGLRRGFRRPPDGCRQ